MKNLIINNLNDFIWKPVHKNEPKWKHIAIKIIRVLYVLIRDIAEGQLTLRAMSLVYTTLLSIVPFLALSFSVLKGFGVHNQIEPILLKFLEPMGEKGIEITKRIIEFVENIKVGVLGALGLFFLIYTVIALLQKIERSFNFIWHVSEARPFSQRFSDYLSVILIGPVLVFTAIGITASVTNASIVKELAAIEPFGDIIHGITRLLPYLLIIFAFTFIYIFIPNTKVKLKSAIVGGFISGILWESSGWLFASFVANSAKYTAIYSAFATMILFMIWVYLGWLIMLIGSSISFYTQNPEYIQKKKPSHVVSNRLKEVLTIRIMMEVAKSFYHLDKKITREKLVSSINIPTLIIDEILSILESNNLLLHSCDDPFYYYPAQPIEDLKIDDILKVVRNANHVYVVHDNEDSDTEETIDMLFNEIDQAVSEKLQSRTLKQLIMSTSETNRH
jgi:membrane protein